MSASPKPKATTTPKKTAPQDPPKETPAVPKTKAKPETPVDSPASLAAKKAPVKAVPKTKAAEVSAETVAAPAAEKVEKKAAKPKTSAAPASSVSTTPSASPTPKVKPAPKTKLPQEAAASVAPKKPKKEVASAVVAAPAVSTPEKKPKKTAAASSPSPPSAGPASSKPKAKVSEAPVAAESPAKTTTPKKKADSSSSSSPSSSSSATPPAIKKTKIPESKLTDLPLLQDEAAIELAAKDRAKRREVSLATWNVRNLSKSKPDVNLKKIVMIISHFDFVALQEIRDVLVVQKLKDLLGATWQTSVSDPIGTDGRKERYAFVWRSNRISLVGEAHLLVDVGNKFVREPYMGFFRASNFDFVIVTIHVVFGDTLAGRRSEIGHLDQVLRLIKERAKDENDLIICGDFNMPPNDVGWDLDGWMPVINPPTTTTVGDVSLYDNFWLSIEHTALHEWKGVAGVVAFDKILGYEDSISGRQLARNEISDHRPVWATFATQKRDDDAALTVELADLRLH